MNAASPRSTAAAPIDAWLGAWLLLICVLVLAMILIGGATRLTDSGLSITEWDLGKGLTPPLTAERWAEEFSLYQRTTEYQRQNRGMSLGDFQSIYWWEWAHRFLGKMIGVVYELLLRGERITVPAGAVLAQQGQAAAACFLVIAGRLRGRLRVTALLFVLGGLQGAIGWWMVSSGLFERLDVSPVRLAIHLGMALIILALGLWVGLDAFGLPREPSKLGAPRWAPFALMALIFGQAMLGALLAGANGGPAYADWPKIGGDWIPPSAFGLEPVWRNFTENHATQHLLHRSLGYLVALAAVVLGLIAALRGQGSVRKAALCLGGLALAQVVLGVLTVVSGSPPWTSLAHQAGAVLLWLGALMLARSALR